MTDAIVNVSTISAKALYTGLLAGNVPYILDVRNKEDFDRWHVEGRKNLQIDNLPYFDFLEDEDAAVARVRQADEVIVICAKEGSAQYVAGILAERGMRVRYLSEGIVSYGNLYDVRDVATNRYGRVVQIARPARGDVSFMVISDGQAAIIDPLRHINHYLSVADEADAHVSHIFDTHAHADHISGGPALNEQTGAPYFMHPYDAIHPLDMLPATLNYTYLADGDEFKVGHFDVRVIWFPGHTLGQVNYLFSDPDGNRFLFTGDGIFLQSFGRPDLGGQGEAWTPILYESLYKRLPPHLTADTMILPAHFSEIDEAEADGVFARPWQEVQAQNTVLGERSEADFTKFVLNNLPHFPPQYVEIKRVNAGLVSPSEEIASELELGKNICALTGEPK